MYWVQTATNPYTYQNMFTGLYLRVSTQGIGEYKPVVAGQNGTPWTQAVH